MTSMRDACTVEEQQLYNNLCLLGLAGPGAKALAVGVELTSYTFRKPSTKVLETVLYQLYAAVWGEATAQKEFRNVYPVADSSQAKEFSQKISDWLKQVKEGGYLELNSISTASQLRTASGFRLITTLLDLSTYALYTIYQRQHPEAATSYTLKPLSAKDAKQQQLQAELSHVARAVAAMAVKAQAQEYGRISRAAADAQQEEAAAAEQLREAYYSLKARHAALCAELDESQVEILRAVAPLGDAVPPTGSRFGSTGGNVATAAAAADDLATAEVVLRSLSGGGAGGKDSSMRDAGSTSADALPPLVLPGGSGGGGTGVTSSTPQRVSQLLGHLQAQLRQVYEPLQMVAGQGQGAQSPQHSGPDGVQGSVSAGAALAAKGAASDASSAGTNGATASAAQLPLGTNAAAHPNAVDGVVLLKAMGRSSRGGEAKAAGVGKVFEHGGIDAGGWGGMQSGGKQVDLVALLHDWSQQMESCVGPICSLTGQPQPLVQQQQQQEEFWSRAAPSAASRGVSGAAASARSAAPGSIHPLLAPAHASSGHAALLATQLAAHQQSLEALRCMEQQLIKQLTSAREHVRELEPRTLGPYQQRGLLAGPGADRLVTAGLLSSSTDAWPVGSDAAAAVRAGSFAGATMVAGQGAAGSRAADRLGVGVPAWQGLGPASGMGAWQGGEQHMPASCTMQGTEPVQQRIPGCEQAPQSWGVGQVQAGEPAHSQQAMKASGPAVDMAVQGVASAGGTWSLALAMETPVRALAAPGQTLIEAAADGRQLWGAALAVDTPAAVGADQLGAQQEHSEMETGSPDAGWQRAPNAVSSAPADESAVLDVSWACASGGVTAALVPAAGAAGDGSSGALPPPVDVSRLKARLAAQSYQRQENPKAGQQDPGVPEATPVGTATPTVASSALQPVQQTSADLATVDVQRIKARLVLLGQRAVGQAHVAATPGPGHGDAEGVSAAAPTGAVSTPAVGNRPEQGVRLLQFDLGPGMQQSSQAAAGAAASASAAAAAAADSLASSMAAQTSSSRSSQGANGSAPAGTPAPLGLPSELLPLSTGPPPAVDSDPALNAAASLWAMEIDSPSADDMGAMLLALGCSPRTREGLAAGGARAGGGVLRNNRLGLPTGAAVGVGAVPQPPVQQVNKGPAMLAGLDAHRMHDQKQGMLSSVAAEAQLEGMGQGKAEAAAPQQPDMLHQGFGPEQGLIISPEIANDISARRLTFSSAWGLPR